MNIPQKFQRKNEIDNDTTQKFKSIYTHYVSALKKFNKSPYYNQNFYTLFKNWFFALPIEKRLSISCIENKWAGIILHQLYTQQRPTKNLRFIPRIEKSTKDDSTNKIIGGIPRSFIPSEHDHFLTYFYMVSEDYETNPKYNTILGRDFLDEIKFYYSNDENFDVNNFNANSIYPFFTLSNKIVSNVKAFDLYFGNLSNERCFESPMQLINNSAIDIPEWAHQPENSKICFSAAEIFCAFFEQVISVRFILSLFDKESTLTTPLYDRLMTTKGQLIEFLKSKNITNFFDYLNVEKITNDIFYSSKVEKFIEKKKKGLVIEKGSNCIWEDNIVLSKLIELVKEYFNSFVGPNREESLIDMLLFMKIDQVFYYDDFLFRKVYEVLHGYYSISQTEDIMKELEDLSISSTKSKKKRKKKNKKQPEVSNNYVMLSTPSTEPLPNDKSDTSSLSSIKEDKTSSSITASNNNILSENSKYIINNSMGSLLFTKGDTKRKSTPSSKISVDHSESLSIVGPIISEVINISLSKIIENDIIVPPPNIPSISDVNNNNCTNNSNGTKKGKKKEKGFFLYSTKKKKKEQNNTQQRTFISKLNIDILTYNQNISEILTQLHPLKEYVVAQIEKQIAFALKNVCSYEIEMYGSYQSGLDIESSDIDLLFKPHNKKKVNFQQLMLIISNHFLSLDIYENVNPIYTATIPLIKLKVNPEKFLMEKEQSDILIKYSAFKHSDLYQSYPYDKNELDLINVDISFPNYTKKNIPHLQVEYIKTSVNENIEIKPIVKILKRLLKVTSLNNSYKGGLSSYTLFLLTLAYNKYIKTKRNNNVSHNTNSYGHFLYDMMKFYANFNFSKKIVNVNEDNPYIDTDISAGEGVPTIIDPVTMLNAGKSSFNMMEVVDMFGGVVKIINDIKTSYEQENDSSSSGNIIEEIMREIVK